MNYKITHYKEGDKPGTLTIGVQVFDDPKYETAAFIFEDVKIVVSDDEIESGGLIGIEAALVFSDVSNNTLVKSEIEPEVETYMKILLQQIGEDMVKLASTRE